MNSAVLWIINIVLIICAIAMIAVVLMQESNSSGGLGAALGGGSTDSFYGKNKTKNKKTMLESATKVLACVIGVLSIANVLLLRM